MNNPWQQFTPYWLRTAAPFGSDLGLPTLPAKLPWESSPPDQSPPSMWAQATPPIPSAPPAGGLFGDLSRGRDQGSASWSHSEMPSGVSRRILGQFTQPQDDPWSHEARPLWNRSMLPIPYAALLVPPPAPSPSGGNPSSPFWLQSVSPFGVNLGLPTLPQQPVKQPWDYPGPNKVPATWDSPTLPIPFALPPTFPPAPPSEHLDSAKYWGAEPAPLGPPVPRQSRNAFDPGDLAKSLGIGVAQGAIALPGVSGDARELFARGAQKAAEFVAPDYAPQVGTVVSRGLRTLFPLLAGPASSDIRHAIEGVTGPFYEPQTVAGDYARTVGEFVPGMFAPGGVARNAARYVVLPALASETAGQWTQGTWAEPWARYLAALATGGAAAAVTRPSTPRGATVPPRSAAEPPPRPVAAGGMPVATPGAPERGAALASQEGGSAAGSVRTAPTLHGKLFDDTRLHEVPPVEQLNLPRYQSERGVPDHIRALDNPEILDRLDEFVRIGLERGGHKAFNIEPLRQNYIAELGLENGQAKFKQLTDLFGAMGSASTDLATLRNASYYDRLIKQGIPLPNPIWDPVKRKLVLPEPLPYPYGHFKQGLHAQKANEVANRGGLDPLTDPKLTSLAEEYRGNQMPIPIDRHVVRTMGVTDVRGRPVDILPRAGYGFVEELLQRRAAKMDLTPGQYQAAGRAGAAEHTGLRSLDPFLVTLEKRLGVTAEYHGITKQEVLRRLIRDGFLLRSLGTVTGAGAAVRQQSAGMQEEID